MPSTSLRNVLVTGATGNVGGATLSALSRAGIAVRAGVLDPGAFRTQCTGVEAVRLDFTDPTTFECALEGVDGVLLVRPPAISKVGPTLNAFVTVADRLSDKHVIFLSVAGADSNRIVPHHRVEAHLATLKIPSTILRPGFFANNLGDAYRMDISIDDRLFVPAGGGRVAFIDARDIADVVTVIAGNPQQHQGRGYTLTGPTAITFTEVAALLTQELGRPIAYEPATVIGYMKHLGTRRLPFPLRIVQTILHVGLRNGGAATLDPTLTRLLGRPGTSLENYIADHLALWKK